MPKGTKSTRRAIPMAERKRTQLSLIVTMATKAIVDAEAERSGRTQSQVAEWLIEKALVYDRTVAGMGQSLDDIRRGNLRAALLRDGYTVVRDANGNEVWFSPGHPQAPPRSGFEPWRRGEREALGLEDVTVPTPEDKR